MVEIKNDTEYKAICQRIEELLPRTNNETPATDRRLVELDILSNLVADYEEEHLPIGEELKYQGYSGTVEYSKEDGCLFGKVLGMKKSLITYEGRTLTELRKDFELSIDFYLENR